MSEPVRQNSSPMQSVNADWPLGRNLLTIFFSILGCLIIWFVTPYNNFVLGNSLISDSFLPVAALFLLMVVVLIINPIFRKVIPSVALNSTNLAFMLGILLMASVPISSGFLRIVPYAIAQGSERISNERRIAEAFPTDVIPKSLFPDPMEYGSRAEVSRGFLVELSSGQPIPWSQWIGPALSWGAFFIFMAVTCLGLALIVYPQWRRNERLAFPLLSLQKSLIENPDPGKLYSPLFRTKGFWIAAVSVFVIYFTRGIHVYDPNAFPAIPLSWGVGEFFTSEPYRFLPDYIKEGRIYFIFLGVAYLMVNRISFSIWFFAIAYGIFLMVGQAYTAPFYTEVVNHHRTGAMVSFTIAILWLGRAHWLQVVKACLGMTSGEEALRDRTAGYMFVIGLIGLGIWMIWVGIQFHWMLMYLLFILMYTLLLSRIVAETGLALLGFEPHHLESIMKLFPVTAFNASSAFIGAAIASIVGYGSRMNLTTMSIHAFGLDENESPRKQTGLVFVFLVVLALGVGIGGAVHLSNSYRNSSTLNGLEQPINTFGVNAFDAPWSMLEQHDAEAWNRPAFNVYPHLAFGAALAAGLQIACLFFPRFPLHPVGLIIVGTWYMQQLWVSVFLGWLLKFFIVRYGGARLYSTARPVFLGLIMGEIFSAAFWFFVPFYFVNVGESYAVVDVLPF